MKQGAAESTNVLIERLWSSLRSVWGLGSENGEDEMIAVTEREFTKIAMRVLHSDPEAVAPVDSGRLVSHEKALEIAAEVRAAFNRASAEAAEIGRKLDEASAAKHRGVAAETRRGLAIWCFLFGHAPKPYSEPVMHYEVRCRRCGIVVCQVGGIKDETGEHK